jgi:hypothetical protein
MNNLKKWAFLYFLNKTKSMGDSFLTNLDNETTDAALKQVYADLEKTLDDTIAKVEALV